MRINLQKYSFLFAEHALNSKLILKQEIEDTLLSSDIGYSSLSCLILMKSWKIYLYKNVGKLNQKYLMKLKILPQNMIF